MSHGTLYQPCTPLTFKHVGLFLTVVLLPGPLTQPIFQSEDAIHGTPVSHRPAGFQGGLMGTAAAQAHPASSEVFRGLQVWVLLLRGRATSVSISSA